jgi:hypothetical protein
VHIGSGSGTYKTLTKNSVGDAKNHPHWSESQGHWRKFPWKTQKITKNALAGPAHRPGEKGEKKQQKRHRRQTWANCRTKNKNKRQSRCFSLPWICQPPASKKGVRMASSPVPPIASKKKERMPAL